MPPGATRVFPPRRFGPRLKAEKHAAPVPGAAQDRRQPVQAGGRGNNRQGGLASGTIFAGNSDRERFRRAF